jgi:OPA family glycerol-3-phosphate transporter-like MFS transporter
VNQLRTVLSNFYGKMNKVYLAAILTCAVYGLIYYFCHDTGLGSFLKKFSLILILLGIVTVILGRLKPVEGLTHLTEDLRRRRVLNWLPLGLTYALLYMGRYNLEVSKHAFGDIKNVAGDPMMANADFGLIFGIGTVIYGVSFVVNGPLTDHFGGRFSILVGAGGALLMNLIMGLCSFTLLHHGIGLAFVAKHFVVVFAILYGINMYFQSYGAVAIVKVNAAWFHVRERGVFGAIFGILISLGVYFAFDLGQMILKGWGLTWVFFVPTIALATFWVLDVIFVRDTPSDAGLKNFDTRDASSGDNSQRLNAIEVFKLMLKNPIILTIASVEFCSGFLRQAIMQWYRTFAKQTDGVLHLKGDFVYENWGLLLCIAGILGGMFAGVISDRVFQSRRGPVTAVLYGGMIAGGLLMLVVPGRVQYDGIFFPTDFATIGWIVVLMSLCIIGVHGMLSGTASMDFGGTKNVGVAVGIIDGFVYLGTAIMSFTYAVLLPQEKLDETGKLIGQATDPHNWKAWPVSMIVVATVGLFLASRLWNAKPKPKNDGGH